MTDALGMALRVIDTAPQPGDEYPMNDEREYEHPGMSGCCKDCDGLMTATISDPDPEC